MLRVWVDLERRGEERGEAGGWRNEGWGRGEGLEVNDISLSLSPSCLFIYLLIYLCFSFPFTAEQSVRTAADEIPPFSIVYLSIYTSHSQNPFPFPPLPPYYLPTDPPPPREKQQQQQQQQSPPPPPPPIPSPKPPFPFPFFPSSHAQGNLHQQKKDQLTN